MNNRIKIPLQILIIISLIIFGFSGCDIYPDAPPDNEFLDEPMDGLTKEQLNRHLKGDSEFDRHFTAQEGVGPIFVVQSCDKCHPGEGKGHPEISFQRFGKMQEDGTFSFLRERGGPQQQTRAIPGYEPEVVPDEATGVSRFLPPVIVGLGLLEAVDDTTIWNLAEAQKVANNDISGRPNLIAPEDFLAPVNSVEQLFRNAPQTRFQPNNNGKYLGRFGRKASIITLRHQTVTAFHEDMGLTTHLLPEDPQNKMVADDGAHDEVDDPEISTAIVSNIVLYLKTLRPPQRRHPDAPDVKAGELLFEEAGCASCHTPTLKTGKSSIAALDQKEFHPYTDLLLHDMGPELDDGYTEGRAKTSEWRTTPLWGLGLSTPFQGDQPYYLHDGRAQTLREAIEYHGGEAAAS